MDQIDEFVDERQKSWCIHCGGCISRLPTSRDHVPSKSLLVKPYPENLPVIQVCAPCNGGFSQDEEYLVAFLSTVLTGSADPDAQIHPSAERAFRRSTKLRDHIESSRQAYVTHGGQTRFVWKPEAHRMQRVIVKNARGHAYFEYGEPMLESPSHVSWAPLIALTAEQRSDFEDATIGIVWPEVGSRMLTRVVTGQDLTPGGWVIVQDGVYRYAVLDHARITVRSVLFEYLATEVRWGD